MISTDKLNWYAAYTRVNQELVIKKKLDELGVENYLPQEERVRETPLGRKKIRVILIHGLIFIRTDKTTSFSLLNDHLLNIVYLKDREGRCSLIIPDKQAVPRGYPQVPHHRTFRQDILPSGGSCQGSFRSRGQRHPELHLRNRG